MPLICLYWLWYSHLPSPSPWRMNSCIIFQNYSEINCNNINNLLTFWEMYVYRNLDWIIIKNFTKILILKTLSKYWYNLHCTIRHILILYILHIFRTSEPEGWTQYDSDDNKPHAWRHMKTVGGEFQSEYVKVVSRFVMTIRLVNTRL